MIKNTIQDRIFQEDFWKAIKNDPKRKIFEKLDTVKSC